MTAHAMNEQDDRQHQDVWAVLPWYVTGTLSPQEQSRVEAHLAGCTACQTEIERCRDLATAVRTPLPSAWEPSAAHFHRLMTRIEAAEVRRAPWRACWEFLHRCYEHTQQLLFYTPSPVRWTLALQGALVVLVVGGLFWQRGVMAPPAPLYRTLSDGGTVNTGNVHIRVVLADDMTVHELQTLLHSVEGSIVQGPSSVGAYTVAVPMDTLVQMPTVLRQLRAHPQVRLAEPLPRGNG